MLLFTQETAHRVSQFKIPLSRNQKAGDEEVPEELVRTGEYPMLVSRLLHGAPHQSAREVALAVATGDVPGRWAHVLTGNRQDSTAGAYLQPLLMPPPIDIGTELAACLLRGTDEEGVHAFSANPEAIEWLLTSAASGGGLAAIELAERVPVAAHRARLPLLIGRGRERLEHEVRLHISLPSHAPCLMHAASITASIFQATLCGGVERELLRARWLDGGGRTTRDPIALPPDVMIAAAAKRSLAKPSLWEPSSAEVDEEVLRPTHDTQPKPWPHAAPHAEPKCVLTEPRSRKCQSRLRPQGSCWRFYGRGRLSRLATSQASFGAIQMVEWMKRAA